MALDAGFEPATKWLTATYSTAELIQNEKRSEIVFKNTKLVNNLIAFLLKIAKRF